MRRFQEIRSGGIDLYDAFKCAETGYVFRVVAPRVDGISSVESVESANIDDESLPERGERLDLKTLTLPVLEKDSLGRAAKQNHREAVSIKLEPFSTLKSVGPLRTTGPILVSLQESLDAIGQAETGNPTAKGMIKKEILAETEMAIVAVGGGSFEIELVSTAQPSLFAVEDESLLSKSLAKVRALLAAGGDTDQLRSLLVPLHSRAASRYRILLEKLYAAHSPVSFRWESPNPRLGGGIEMTYQQVQAALTAVTQVEREVADKIRVTGQLVIADTLSNGFGLYDQRSKATYRGKVADSALPALTSATMMKEYDALISVIREISSATGDEKETYELLELNPA